MNLLGQAFSEYLIRLVGQLPAMIARKAPSWLASHILSYFRWLWHLQLTSRLLMLALTIVSLEVVLAWLPGPHAFFEQMGGLVVIGLGVFLLASLLLGAGKR